MVYGEFKKSKRGQALLRATLPKLNGVYCRFWARAIDAALKVARGAPGRPSHLGRGKVLPRQPWARCLCLSTNLYRPLCPKWNFPHLERPWRCLDRLGGVACVMRRNVAGDAGVESLPEDGCRPFVPNALNGVRS